MVKKGNLANAPLLNLLPPEHAIFTEPVAEDTALRPGLVKIVISRTTSSEIIKRPLPIQWTTEEAAQLIHEIRGVSWQLDESGWPIAYSEIHEIFKDFCKRYK